MESIVKYLIEVKHFSKKAISSSLNRDQRTIWSTYDKASKKFKGELDTTSEFIIPLSIFASRTRSVLESLVFYLKEDCGLSLRDIALTLQRSDSTIWTVYDRARRKDEN